MELLEQRCGDFLTLLQPLFVLSETLLSLLKAPLFLSTHFFLSPSLCLSKSFQPWRCLPKSLCLSLAVPLAKWIGALMERLPRRWAQALGSRLGTWPSLAQTGFSVKSPTEPASSLSWLTVFSFPSLPNIVFPETSFHLLPDGHFFHVYEYSLIKHTPQLHFINRRYCNKHAFHCRVNSFSSGSLEGLWLQTSLPSVVLVLFLILHCFTLQMNLAITSGANEHLRYMWSGVHLCSARIKHIAEFSPCEAFSKLRAAVAWWLELVLSVTAEKL